MHAYGFAYADQAETRPCMHAYADVISLGGDLRYSKQCTLCWNINCTDLPSVEKFPFSVHEIVADNGSTSIATLHSMQPLTCQVKHGTMHSVYCQWNRDHACGM